MVNDAQPVGGGPGTLLRAAREARELTPQDVADTLNLMVRVIDDIEAENWSRLPPAAFSRGYVRAYAKLLEIDPESVVQAFDQAVGHARVVHAPTFKAMPPAKGGIAELMQKQPGTVLTGAVVLVICAVLIVLWAVWPDVANESAAAAKLVPRTVVVQPALSVAKPAANTGSTSTALPLGIESASSSVEPTPVEQQSVEQQAANRGISKGARRITANGEDRLAFVFVDDCWVEVKDGSGRGVYSDLSRSGESLELVGQAPFLIMLGYAPGVTLSYNGERVALSPHTRNNVATLALGQ